MSIALLIRRSSARVRLSRSRLGLGVVSIIESDSYDDYVYLWLVSRKGGYLRPRRGEGRNLGIIVNSVRIVIPLNTLRMLLISVLSPDDATVRSYIFPTNMLPSLVEGDLRVPGQGKSEPSVGIEPANLGQRGHHSRVHRRQKSLT